jgi:hypothetical protein
MGGLLVFDVSNPSNPAVIQEFETVDGQAFFKVEAAGRNVYVTEGQCGLRVLGTTPGGLAEVFFENVPNPIRIGGGAEVCTESSDDDPWAWDIDDANGLAFVTYGVLGPRDRTDSHRGSFQSIDFRQPGSGLLGECGLGAELVLALPLLAWYRRRQGLSRNR